MILQYFKALCYILTSVEQFVLVVYIIVRLSNNVQFVLDIITEWVLRGLLMVFGVGLLVTIAMYMKLKL